MTTITHADVQCCFPFKRCSGLGHTATVYAMLVILSGNLHSSVVVPAAQKVFDALAVHCPIMLCSDCEAS